MERNLRTGLTAGAFGAGASMHALGLWGGALATRGCWAVEILGLISLAVFYGVRCRAVGFGARRVAMVGIFTASLVLALSAPALFVVSAAERAEVWALLGSVSAAAVPWLARLSWAASFALVGLGLHLQVQARWRMGNPVRRPAA